MSYTQRLANYAYGVSNFLFKQGFDVSGSGKKANDIMIEFLKSKKLRYRPWSANQKHSLKTADMYNAETIQEHWKEFRQFILKKKLNIKNE
jgi:hypothetical protein